LKMIADCKFGIHDISRTEAHHWSIRRTDRRSDRL
jgi:hypothetical protein